MVASFRLNQSKVSGGCIFFEGHEAHSNCGDRIGPQVEFPKSEAGIELFRHQGSSENSDAGGLWTHSGTAGF
jgi:hypothetical protein